MSSKHTPEPWAAGGRPGAVGVSDDANGNEVFQAQGETTQEANEIRDRINACVNACAGMDDPAAAIREAREALRGLLTTDTYWIDDCIERANDGDDDADALWKQIQKARSALAGLGGAE